MAIRYSYPINCVRCNQVISGPPCSKSLCLTCAKQTRYLAKRSKKSVRLVRPRTRDSCCIDCGAALSFKESTSYRCSGCKKKVKNNASRQYNLKVRLTRPPRPTSRWTPEFQSDYLKQYRKEHPEQTRLYKQREYQIKQNDVLFRLPRILRCRLNQAVKHNYKAGSAVTDLGCSIGNLKLHLESKFLPGMTWSNWSRTGWHIDHIKPLSIFDLSNPAQVKTACHYTNLQPLWYRDNIRKGNR